MVDQRDRGAADSTATVRTVDGGRGAVRRVLLAIADGVTTTHPLPERGEITLGRGTKCTIQIDHPTLSRTHLAIQLGPALAVTDHGVLYGAIDFYQAARNRGIKSLRMDCLAENQRMQQLARKFDAEFSFDFGSVTGAVDPPHSTALSLVREAMADSHGIASAIFEVQSRLFRPAPSI